ncbi:ABC transporter substrate-binding protein [Roseomonas sp. 18066]|uniref:ABC transporter substrate-binding protein n=1 Tax=Roseomonas sp. 18066 TaxID=2681412 RepID=UPI0013568CD5|nr:ABC transporter substrate-binding protein [Roseomonas sp. 18066]
MPDRRQFLLASASTLLAPMAGPAAAAPPQVLRVAMTAADLPTVTGIPNNGGEGFRFLGYPAYDSLVNWDYTRTEETANIAPGLATEWKIDPADPKRWLFSLRQGARFHDDTPVTAEAILWNLARIYDDKSPQYDAPASPIVKATVSMLDTFSKVDDATIAITTKYPFGFFPYLVTRILVVSPTQWEKVGRSWQEFAKRPIGSGPFRINRVVPGQYVEMVRNETYWDKARIPKLEKLTVYPMPEATTRMAALRSGQVDWIEVPPPDAIPSLRQAGFQVSLWPYPHTYPYAFNCRPGSPFADVRVRQAANYAIDRDGMCSMLNQTGKPAVGLYPPGNPVFGNPKNRYSYDPAKARALLAEAGYGPGKPLKAKIMISTSGSGQMVPIPMNELMQQNFAAVGMEIEFDVVEWGTMLVAIRNIPGSAPTHGVDGINISLSYTDPSSMFRYYASDSASPVNYNWGHFKNDALDALLRKAQSVFDADEQTRLLAEAHAIVVDEAPWLFIVHDQNPRGLAKKVKNFRPAQSWYQDFTQITIE